MHVKHHKNFSKLLINDRPNIAKSFDAQILTLGRKQRKGISSFFFFFSYQYELQSFFFVLNVEVRVIILNQSQEQAKLIAN